LSGETLLSVSNIVKRFGRFEALSDVSFSLKQGEVLALIGPNGSGKTTLLNVLSGLLLPERGIIYYQGKRIEKLSPHKRARLGINRTFQTPRPFSRLSVKQNVLIAMRFSAQERREMEERADELLELTGLSEFSHKEASTLNTGQRKMLDLARALAGSPKLLLIDELAAGMNHAEMESLSRLLKNVGSHVDGMIVVEHVMGFIRMVTERVIVLDAGRKIYDGEFTGAVKDERVRSVYLGK
jgi:branched-chain amino acid transport system ATP-binding protein